MDGPSWLVRRLPVHRRWEADFDVHLTRAGAARKFLGTSLARRFMVVEPPPPAGTAEVWTFEEQYRYKSTPFGLMSLPVNLIVRGV